MCHNGTVYKYGCMAVTNKIIQSIKNDQNKLPNINLRITENRVQKNEGFRIFR